MSRIIQILVLLSLFIACVNDTKKNDELPKVDFDILRFEQQFYKANETSLGKLKNKYSYMFPSTVHDSVWLHKINNDQEQFLFSESQRVFNDFSAEQLQLTVLFQQIKYRNINFKVPNIISHISNLDFQYPVIYADSLLFISLDMYLGKDHIAYSDFPRYLSQNFTKDRLIVDVSEQVNRKLYKNIRARSFRDKMLNEAKFVFANELNLPLVDKHLIIGYSKEKFEWAVKNESDVWKYFIENEILYSTESSLNTRFLDLAPFSKFYLESDNDSPGRIGVWMGWQIIRSYMKNNDVTLQELMKASPEIIYNKSKYKPRKD